MNDMSDTPRTERLIETMEREKQDIWQTLTTITEWARGLERECASLEVHVTQSKKHLCRARGMACETPEECKADAVCHHTGAAIHVTPPMICYTPCKAHEGMGFTMESTALAHSSITVCPLCGVQIK